MVPFLIAAMLGTILTGQGCTQGMGSATAAAAAPKTINIWAVNDDEDVYDAILNDYHALHPNVTITQSFGGNDVASTGWLHALERAFRRADARIRELVSAAT